MHPNKSIAYTFAFYRGLCGKSPVLSHTPTSCYRYITSATTSRFGCITSSLHRLSLEEPSLITCKPSNKGRFGVDSALIRLTNQAIQSFGKVIKNLTTSRLFCHTWCLGPSPPPLAKTILKKLHDFLWTVKHEGTSSTSGSEERAEQRQKYDASKELRFTFTSFTLLY